MEGNHLSLSVMDKALFFVAFPVLRATMKRTFPGLYSPGSVTGVELVCGNAGWIGK